MLANLEDRPRLAGLLDSDALAPFKSWSAASPRRSFQSQVAMSALLGGRGVRRSAMIGIVCSTARNKSGATRPPGSPIHAAERFSRGWRQHRQRTYGDQAVAFESPGPGRAAPAQLDQHEDAEQDTRWLNESHSSVRIQSATTESVLRPSPSFYSLRATPKKSGRRQSLVTQLFPRAEAAPRHSKRHG